MEEDTIRNILKLSKERSEYINNTTDIKTTDFLADLVILPQTFLPSEYKSFGIEEKRLYLASLTQDFLIDNIQSNSQRSNFELAKKLYELSDEVIDVFSKDYNEDGNFTYHPNRSTFDFCLFGKDAANKAIHKDAAWNLYNDEYSALHSYRAKFFYHMGLNDISKKSRFFSAALLDIDKASDAGMNLMTEVNILENMVENIDSTYEKRESAMQRLLLTYETGIENGMMTMSRINDFIKDIDDDILYISNRSHYGEHLKRMEEKYQTKRKNG